MALGTFSRSPTGPGRVVHSVAVLPFELLSGNKEHEYLADGLTDALIGELARVAALRVISRTSVMPLKRTRRPPQEIARTLNVDTITEGSLFRDAGRIRISIRLIDATRDLTLWTGSYEGDVTDLFTLQNRVAEAIAAELRVSLMDQAGHRHSNNVRVNLNAYDEYLKGRHEYFREFTRESLERAIVHFQNAARLDGSYAPAYAGLANCYYMLSSIYLPPTEAMPKARAAAMRALEIDSNLGDAHAILALVRSVYEFDRDEADRGFQRAIERKPSDSLTRLWYGLHLIAMSRFDQGLAEIDLAQKLDPSSPGMNAYAGAGLYLARRYSRVIERMGTIADINPDYHHPHAWLALAYEQNRDWPRAIMHIEKAHAADSESDSLAQLGHIYAMAGRTDDARAVLRKLQTMAQRRYLSSYNFGVLYAALGETDEAFRYLSMAREDRGEWFAFAGVDPRLDPLRSDRRFTEVLRSVGLHE